MSEADEAQKKFDEVEKNYQQGRALYRDYLEAWTKLSTSQKTAVNQRINQQANVGSLWDSIASDYDAWKKLAINPEPETKTSPCERGEHDWKVYDSGFTRFEYCSICNKEQKG